MGKKRSIICLVILAITVSLMPMNMAAAKKIKLTNTTGKKVMRIGSSFALKTNQKSSNLTFSSSKQTVADISEDGIIHAHKKGRTTITIASGSSQKKLQITVKTPVGYRISRVSGNYSDVLTTTVKAKKGYQVYYSTNGKFKNTKRIKTGKSKKFTFRKSRTLSLYPVKSSKKISTVKLNQTKNKNNLRADYLYTIVASSKPSNSATVNSRTGKPTPANNVTQETATPTEHTIQVSATPTSTCTSVTNTSTPKPIITPDDSAFQGDDAASDYVSPVRAEYDETDMNELAKSDVVDITIPTSASGVKTTKDTYEISKKNKLTILAPGTYMLHTESTETASDGLIEVDFPDGTEGTVHLILDGVHLTSHNNTEPTSDTGLITIKKSVTRAIITVKSGSINTLNDIGATGIDKDDNTSTTYTGGIVCKKIPLTINGSGQLNIFSTHGNGIKATNTLKILNANIHVSGGTDNQAVGHNGITGKTAFFIKNANLYVNSNQDALKTTLDKNDIAEDSTLELLGNMDIDGGFYELISANGDGVQAYRTLYLNPSEMNVTTKNAAASTEDSSYKAIKAGTSILIPDTAGTIVADTTATYSASRKKNGANDPVADDTLHCDGYIRIDGGTLSLASGDDGIHSDYGLNINGGNIIVSNSYEGLESGDITINDGDIQIKSRDDGLNAAGGNNSSSDTQFGHWDDWFNKGDSSSSSKYQIIINGGNITIDADGDGIDSNGNIFFKGGTVNVNGPTNSGNGALDYGDNRDCVCEISGGTLIAAGAVGMDAAPTSGSSQPVVNIRLSSSQSAGTYVVLKDNTGNTVMTAQPAKTFQSVIMSCDTLKLGNSYTVYYGNSLNNLTQGTTFTFTSASVSTGSGNFPGGGWRPGGR